MNLTRLMALGTLARYGPQHGHQIRRLADVTNVGEWGGVSVGALYRELRTMEREGLVETLRTEKVGNRPARTVYQITADGRMDLAALRDQAVRPTGFGHDPLGVALTFAADGVDPAELREMLRVRRDRLAIDGAEISAERERLLARGQIGPLVAAIMRRGAMHAQTEVSWHDELDAALAEVGGGGLAGVSGGSAIPLSGGSFEVGPRQAAFEIAAGGTGGSPADEPPDGRDKSR
jgi:DNA-binding PadR family transcriptional regulator